MSIIYDALNKIQENRQIPPYPNKKKTAFYRVWVGLLAFLFIAILSILLIYFYPMIIKKQPAPSQPLPSAQAYLLNGVFLSDKHQVAIINHRHYHIGDNIDDMKITSIDINHVKLKDKQNRILVLSMLR